MRADTIAEVGINDAGGLYIRPSTAAFPYIYREAMEVGWDPAHRWLFGPEPRECTYLNWFAQIVAAASEQEVSLRLDSTTQWTNVPDELREAIIALPLP